MNGSITVRRAGFLCRRPLPRRFSLQTLAGRILLIALLGLFLCEPGARACIEQGLDGHIRHSFSPSGPWSAGDLAICKNTVVYFKAVKDDGSLASTTDLDAVGGQQAYDVANYSWDFNWNTGCDACGVTTSNTFSTNGAFTIRLDVCDDDGSGYTNDTDQTDQITVSVVTVDLQASGVTEGDEETVGAFLGVNGDDDDSDETVDKDDSSVSGEDDLLAITLSIEGAGSLPQTDTVTLTWTQDAKVDVFEGSNKSTPVSSGATYQLSQLPKTLYVEGDEASSTARDIEMKLEFTKNGVTCDDKVKVTVLAIDITDAADNPITTTQNVSIGQKISLKARVLPSGLTGIEYQWTISGNVVKNYEVTGSPQVATVTALPESDKQQPTIYYHWTDLAAGSERTVSVAVTVAGLEIWDEVDYTIEKPTVLVFGSYTTDVAVLYRFWPEPPSPEPKPWLQFSVNRWIALPPPWYVNRTGIDWRALVTTSPSFGGEIKYVQLIQASLRRRLVSGSVEVASNSGQWWLDQTDPYGALDPRTPSTHQWSAEADSAFAIEDNDFGHTDDPGMELSEGWNLAAWDNAQFKTHLMFRPSGADSIWVPLGRLDWYFSGEAQSQDGGVSWCLVSGSHSTNPTGTIHTSVTTMEFPTWTVVWTTGPGWVPQQ